MKENYTINDDLLVKYLVNETSGNESTLVESWISDNKNNREYFEKFLSVWEQSLALQTPVSTDENAAWERLQQRIQKDEKTKQQSATKLFNKTWLRIAAMFILIAGTWLSYTAIQQFNKPIINNLASADKVVTETLSDGSLITVNKYSSLTYPSSFTGNKREVSLTGEAFFKISPDKKKPFIIHVNDVSVRVVGTSFNIKSVNGKTEVVVETGIVQVTKNGKTVELHPREKIITNWQNEAIKKDSVQDILYNYYRSKEFICNNTPLQRLTDILNEAYNANIVIENEQLKQLPITTVFKDEPLDNILTVISETFSIQVEKREDKIILR